MNQDDVLMKLFLLSLDKKKWDLIKHTCIPKGFSSSTIFIREFLEHYGHKFQQFEDTIQDLEDAFRGEIFPLNWIENLREISFSPIENQGTTFEEALVFILPPDEDKTIQPCFVPGVINRMKKKSRSKN